MIKIVLTRLKTPPTQFSFRAWCSNIYCSKKEWRAWQDLHPAWAWQDFNWIEKQDTWHGGCTIRGFTEAFYSRLKIIPCLYSVDNITWTENCVFNVACLLWLCVGVLLSLLQHVGNTNLSICSFICRKWGSALYSWQLAIPDHNKHCRKYV